MSRNRRLHEKLVQVLPEHLDRAILRLLRKLIPDLSLDRRLDQPMIAVRHGLLENRSGKRILRAYRLTLQIAQDLFLRRLNLHGQELLLLSPVQRKNSVPRQFLNRFLKLIVHLIDRLCFRIFRRRNHTALSHGCLSNPSTVIRIIRNRLRNNVHRPLNGFPGSLNLFFF